MAEPYIRSRLLGEFQRFLTSRNASFDALARTAGLDPHLLDDPTVYLPLNATMQLFDLAAEELKNPALSLEFAQSVSAGATGLIGELFLSASTVRDGLIIMTRSINVFMSPFQIAYTEARGTARIEWRFPSSATAPRIQFNLFVLALLILRIRAARGQDWSPLAVELEHKAPDCPDALKAMLGKRVRFQAASNVIVIDQATLATAMPGSNPGRHRMMLDLADRWLSENARTPDIIASARQSISGLLKNGQPDLDTVAEAVGISAGSLQWRLERAGTTFERVLTEERRDQAAQLLRDTDRSLTQIAYDLGFSDPSAFTRAARRWFGIPPREWRRRQQRRGPE